MINNIISILLAALPLSFLVIVIIVLIAVFRRLFEKQEEQIKLLNDIVDRLEHQKKI